jgi:hypothetical protein
VDALKEITRLARDRRVVRLGYKRAGETVPTEYLVEPYRLQDAATGPAVQCWQLSPAPEGRSPWRDFRVDRVTSVADGGRTFEARAAVHLGTELAPFGERTITAKDGALDAPVTSTQGAVTAAPSNFNRWGHRQIGSLGPAGEYFHQLEGAMLDGQVNADEMAVAAELSNRVPPDQRKAVHARVYANVLHEVLEDGRIAHREELYLAQVRELLVRLGWAP